MRSEPSAPLNNNPNFPRPPWARRRRREATCVRTLRALCCPFEPALSECATQSCAPSSRTCSLHQRRHSRDPEEKRTRQREVDPLAPRLRKRRGLHSPSDARFLARLFCSIKPPLCFLSSSSFFFFFSSALLANGFWSEPVLCSQSENARPDVDVRRRSRKHYFDLPRVPPTPPPPPLNLYSFTR